MFDPRDYFAQHTQGTRYGLPWAQWYVSGGKQGIEPPGEPEAAHEAVRSRPRRRWTRQARRAHETGVRLCADAFETIGVCLAVNTAGGSARTAASTCRRKCRIAWPCPTRPRRCRSSSPSRRELTPRKAGACRPSAGPSHRPRTDAVDRRPNILLLFPDQLRADFVGCYGAEVFAGRRPSMPSRPTGCSTSARCRCIRSAYRRGRRC